MVAIGMDLVSISIIVGAGFAMAAAVQHFYDRYHPRGLYLRTLKRSTELAAEIGTHVENALNRVADKQKTEIAAETEKHFGGLNREDIGQAIQAMGNTAASDAKLTRSLQEAVGRDLLGPYGPLLQEHAPSIYAWLEDHPQSVMWALKQPWVQGAIQKAAAVAGGVTRSATVQGGTYGWGP